MTISYNVTGTERKRLADYISGFMGTEKKYLGAPTFAYQIGYLTVSKDGAVSFEDRGYNSDIDALMAELEGQGFHTEDTIAKADTAAPEATGGEDAAQTDEANASTEQEAAPAEEGATQPHGFGLTVTLPAASFTADGLNNLHALIASKGRLIRKALGIDLLPVQVEAETVSFPWFEGRELDADEVKTYTHLIAALCDMARNQKRITAKEKVTDNDKYAFRCFLLRLGFIGAEFKDERKILLRDLSGNSAFKSGKRTAEVLQPESPASTATVEAQGDREVTEALADELLIQQVNTSFGEEAVS
ncbi:MAG: virulence protein [Oscillospiraceae bacterium]|nr:virulence protein [Oscillospiraceae bacterium]